MTAMTRTERVELFKPHPEPAERHGMTDVEAAWIREHAWTKTMRATYKSTPAFYHHCACQWSRCGSCDRGEHSNCIHGPRGYQPFPSSEGYITNSRQHVLGWPERFNHPSRSATGWHRDSAAYVWLADRRCIWSCPCECRAAEPAQPQPIVLVPARQRRRHDPAGQEALFGVMTGG